MLCVEHVSKIVLYSAGIIEFFRLPGARFFLALFALPDVCSQVYSETEGFDATNEKVM